MFNVLQGCLNWVRLEAPQLAGVCCPQLAKRIDYCSIPATNGSLFSIFKLRLTLGKSQLCCLTEVRSRTWVLSRADWHPHLLASTKQMYRNPPTCIAAKWPYGGALHLEPLNFGSPFGFSAASLGPRGNKGRMTAKTSCIVLHSLSGSSFYRRLPQSVASRGEPRRVCAKLPLSPQLQWCDGLTWSVETPAAGNGDGGNRASIHRLLAPQTLTLMLHDAATG